MPAMTEFSAMSRPRFEAEVVPASRPAVVRSLVADWPLVAVGRQGLQPLLDYLATFDVGASVDALLARPDGVRAFGNAGLDGFNFVRDRRPLAALLAQFWRYSHFAEPPSLAVQSALLSEALPGLVGTHAIPLLAAAVPARLWMGNRGTTPAHFDSSHNLACVAAGRRRFTLLPPHCAPDLYLGPPDLAPTAAPMTVAHLHAPDFERFPRLRQALAQAVVAELAPGDAI